MGNIDPAKVTTKLTPEQQEFFTLIRTGASWDQQYLVSALFSLIPVNAPGLETMAVDKRWRVYIDFDYFMNKFEGEAHAAQKRIVHAKRILNHEPWHLLRRHPDRFEQVDQIDKDGVFAHPRMWNYAGDITINQDIRDLVPDTLIFPESFDLKENLTTEEYYNLLMEKMKKDAKCKSCDGSGRQKQNQQKPGDQKQNQDGQGNNDQNGDGQDKGDQEGQGEGDQPGEGQGDQDGGNQPGGSGDGHAPGGDRPCPDCNGSGFDPSRKQESPTCGSGAGDKQPWELRDNEAPGVTDERADDLVRETAMRIRDMADRTPGDKALNRLLQWSNEVLKPAPIDWRKLMRAQIKKGISAWAKGHVDYTYRRPNRRNTNNDILLPSMHSPRPRIGVAVDSSGSNVHNLQLIAAQVDDLMKQTNIRGKNLLAFAVDASVKDVKSVANINGVRDAIMRGGGGTDMRVGYEKLAELFKEGKIDMGVLITDLATPWPAERPANMPFITIGVVNEHAERDAKVAKETIGSWSNLILIPESSFDA